MMIQTQRCLIGLAHQPRKTMTAGIGQNDFWGRNPVCPISRLIILLLRQSLVDYVRDYLTRGDAALIEYADQEKTVRLADEKHALKPTSTYINDLLNTS